ncbi:hypothetical protein JTB14_021473 [Gonioctena quinquepunctata]|nr:hypothetical protein JTB14_021473 [Gonioctena quinquepunctata]
MQYRRESRSYVTEGALVYITVRNTNQDTIRQEKNAFRYQLSVISTVNCQLKNKCRTEQYQYTNTRPEPHI